MKLGGASPLRFIGLVLGGWLCGRLVFFTPDWLTEIEVEPATPPVLVMSAASRIERRISVPAQSGQPPAPAPLFRFAPVDQAPPHSRIAQPPAAATLSAIVVPVADSAENRPASLPRPAQLPATSAAIIAPHPLTQGSSPLNRWSLSTWVFVRQGRASQLATAGTLGGSQIGARATYALTPQWALSARFYTPINQLKGAEAALGIEAQPLRTLPVRLLAERRQAIGRDGRSAFAVLAHGGLNETRLIGPVRIEGYAQAGIVGLRSRDGFVDGAIRLGVPLDDRLILGVGGWGAAQPDVSRIDLGPQASYRLPIAGGSARISAEWRFRIAGDVRPGSGPALTLSTGF